MIEYRIYHVVADTEDHEKINKFTDKINNLCPGQIQGTNLEHKDLDDDSLNESKDSFIKFGKSITERNYACYLKHAKDEILNNIK